MIEKKINSLSIWYFENLSKYKMIYHFVSTRIGGVSSFPYESLNLGFHVGDDPENVIKNRELLALALGIPLNNFTVAKQIHDGNVKIVTEQEKGFGIFSHDNAIDATDAMVTNVQNICLMVLLADCVPILFLDPKKKVIGVAHAGWKGTLKLVAQNTINVMKEKFGCSTVDILVGIGPSIGPCHYEVGPEVISQVEKIFHTKKGLIFNESPDGKGYFNLWEANRKQILLSGVPANNIETAEICTYCNSALFFSERYQKGKTGRFGAGIMIKS